MIKLKKRVAMILLIVMLGRPRTAYAEGPWPGGNPIGSVINSLPGGLIPLLNSLVGVIFLAAGILVFFRVLLAGIQFMNAGGDAKKIEQAWNSIYMSLIGLVVLISAFAVAALVGIILFNDPFFILNPKVQGPGT